MLESARKLLAAGWGDEGTTRIQRAFTVDPDIIRSLDTGQVCYIRRKSAVYIQLARARPSPLPLPAADSVSAPRRPGGHRRRSAGYGSPGPMTQPTPVIVPEGPGGLDDVLGPADGGGR